MQNIIVHIPHSSSVIPFFDGFTISLKEFEAESLKLTDWHTEDLFNCKDATMIVAEFSRIFCDPERFVNDEEEVMAQYGMGVLYETTDDGRLMRKVTPELREKIIREYYVPHHTRLNNAVKDQLDQHSRALIIDCHSFCDTPFQRDLNKQPNRPDICIGIDKFHTKEKLADFSVRYFQNEGLSIAINTPYSGTIVPLEYYGVDNRVQSIMVEINRKLYLNNGTNVKSDNYKNINRIIQGYLSKLNAYIQR